MIVDDALDIIEQANGPEDMRQKLSVLEVCTAAGYLALEVRRLWSENDQLRRDRYEALTVHTKEGLLASEWLARTGRAEATVKRVRGLVAKWRDGASVKTEDDDAHSERRELANELEAVLRGSK